jgi:thymidylate synthase
MQYKTLRPKINYHYTIYNKPLYHYDFVKYNEIVDETCYKYRVEPRLPDIINNLRRTPNSRQEVIMTHNNENYACLLSLQFQIDYNRLVLIANFRSQCAVNGRPYDSMMLRYFATQASRALSLKTFIIYVNVGNYHLRIKLDS